MTTSPRTPPRSTLERLKAENERLRALVTELADDSEAWQEREGGIDGLLLHHWEECVYCYASRNDTRNGHRGTGEHTTRCLVTRAREVLADIAGARP